MSELTCWKSQAEELNRKVGDILVMKKTRNRINLPEKKFTGGGFNLAI